MTEYIEREAALRDWPLCDEPADACKYIRNYPAADVRPVVRGKWEAHEAYKGAAWGFLECSVCGNKSWTIKHNFCPNCGADMRAEEGE